MTPGSSDRFRHFRSAHDLSLERDVDHATQNDGAIGSRGFQSAQEVTMKRMLAVAVFLLASSTAHAQYEFQYGGRTIRIDPDRGTVSIPGVYDNTGIRIGRAQCCSPA